MKKLLLAGPCLVRSPVLRYADFILTTAQVGQSGVVNYNGQVEGTVLPGLTAQITFKLH